MKNGILLVLFGAMIFTACENDIEENALKVQSSDLISSENGMLVFTSFDKLTQVWDEIDQGRFDFNKLDGLDYLSYDNANPNYKKLDNDLKMQDFQAIRIISNQDGKFVVGDTIYQIQDYGILIFNSKNGKLIEKRKNIIEYYDRNQKRFIQKDEKRMADARTFDQYAYYPVPVVIPYDPTQVRDKFLRIQIWPNARYYYLEELVSVQFGNLVTADYFKFNGGTCLCQYANTYPQQYYYNTSGVLIYMGYSNLGYEAGFGVGLSIGNSVKQSVHHSLFTWSSSL